MRSAHACAHLRDIAALTVALTLRALVQKIQGLETLVNLNQLWLGRNRITEITNLSALTNLRQISLQANRLECMRVRCPVHHCWRLTVFVALPHGRDRGILASL